MLGVPANARVIVLEREENYWWVRHGETEGWVLPDILRPLPRPPPPRRAPTVSTPSTSGIGTAEPSPLPAPVQVAQSAPPPANPPQSAPQPTQAPPPAAAAAITIKQGGTLVEKLGVEPTTAERKDLLAGIFYARLPPFTVLTADGQVVMPLPEASAGFKPPNDLPEDRIRAPEDMVGPAIVSHDQTWHQALYPDLYAYDKAALAEAQAEEEARRQRELERERRRKVGRREVVRDAHQRSDMRLRPSLFKGTGRARGSGAQGAGGGGAQADGG